MIAYTERFQDKNTTELRTGDILSHHGAILVLGKRQERRGVIWFHTQVVTNGAIPRGWIDPATGWIIQGNELARWTVVNH